MDKSYFIYKTKSKDKIRKKYKYIAACEKRIERIKAGKYNNILYYKDQAIRFYNNIINKERIKIQKRIDIICHG